jgi:hypothetical protein
MSLDRRLREGLGRLPVELDDGLDRIDVVLARGRRRRLARRLTSAAPAVVVVAAALFVAPRTLDLLRDGGGARPASPEELARRVAGTYSIALDPGAGVPAYEQGDWTIRLLPSGAMEVSPPAGFTAEFGRPSGAVFSIDGEHFRTNILTDLCLNSIGTYAWTLDDDRLSFTPLTEDCAPRRALLTAAEWVRASPDPGGR